VLSSLYKLHCCFGVSAILSAFANVRTRLHLDNV